MKNLAIYHDSYTSGCVTIGLFPWECMFWVKHTGTKLSGERSENSGNLTLGSTAMLGFAGTEIRHDFLVREDLLQWSSHGPQG